MCATLVVVFELTLTETITKYWLIKFKFSTMDVLAPISMKNAARMRYAV